jgi:hypothetical protein
LNLPPRYYETTLDSGQKKLWDKTPIYQPQTDADKKAKISPVKVADERCVASFPKDALATDIESVARLDYYSRDKRKPDRVRHKALWALREVFSDARS